MVSKKDWRKSPDGIMSGLKDFQRATVMRICELFKAGQRKILVCDEVGLGKTLIARGTILSLMNGENPAGKDCFRVVYICSNAIIADQNLARLGVHLDATIQNSFSGRLSMQHLQIYRKRGHGGLQLIPLTPATSFSLTGRLTGTGSERALMYAILAHVPDLEEDLPELEIILCNNIQSWVWLKPEAEAKVKECDEQSGKNYIKEMTAAIKVELDKKDETGHSLLDHLRACCEELKMGKKLPPCAKSLVGKLRFAFAQISVGLLKPDLVIMDEFQRFRTIIQADAATETGLLKERFFKGANCRVLLLSATPYKLYTTLAEQEAGDVEDHYSEFLQVLEFLQDRDTEKQARFKRVWENYSLQLREFSQDNASLLLATRQAEDELFKYICRTERIGESQLCAKVDSHAVKKSVEVGNADITAYLECRQLAEETGASTLNLTEYVKSSPYLLSFMHNYEFKRDLERFFRDNPRKTTWCKKPCLWLIREKIEKYIKIPANNARLNALLEDCFKFGSECLLWVPPAKPYYTGEKEVFRQNTDFSKILIFSSWEMVPRMIASLVSYEAERRSIGKLTRKKGKANYFAERKYPSRLEFRLDNKGAPSTMLLFALLNPSRFLVDAWTPLESLNQKLELAQIRDRLIKKINTALDRAPNPSGDREDKRWYYLAPLLLDDPADVESWLENLKEHGNQNRKNEVESRFQKHVGELRAWYLENGASGGDLGPRPENLAEVLADFSLASPAVCFFRALKPYAAANDQVAKHAFRLASLFLKKCLDSPQGTAAIELVYGGKLTPLTAVTYCRDGNLQAVLDEYAFILAHDKEKGEDCMQYLTQEMEDGLDFRVATYKADTFESFKKRIKRNISEPKEKNAISLSTHFCAAFARSEGGDEDKGVDRKSSVRKAFNSPFRPFALATTSIGQEGLDFHAYCRKIMHWNLPHNPVELEQREGRINRFMCHMIRQNIAKRYGNTIFTRSVWKEMFEEAERQEKNPGCSDLIPWWGLRETEDMVHLERLAPMFPCSEDIDNYERLMSILVLYRLSLGQPAQEELLESIARRCKDPDNLKKFFINLSPFYRC